LAWANGRGTNCGTMVWSQLIKEMYQIDFANLGANFVDSEKSST
jgi:hypothetical protein